MELQDAISCLEAMLARPCYPKTVQEEAVQRLLAEITTLRNICAEAANALAYIAIATSQHAQYRDLIERLQMVAVKEAS